MPSVVCGRWLGSAGTEQSTMKQTSKREPMPSAGLTDVSACGIVEPGVGGGIHTPRADRNLMPSVGTTSASADGTAEPEATVHPKLSRDRRDLMEGLVRFLGAMSDARHKAVTSARTANVSSQGKASGNPSHGRGA